MELGRDHFPKCLRFQLKFTPASLEEMGLYSKAATVGLQRRDRLRSCWDGKFYGICGSDGVWGVKASVILPPRFVDLIWAMVMPFTKIRSVGGASGGEQAPITHIFFHTHCPSWTMKTTSSL